MMALKKQHLRLLATTAVAVLAGSTALHHEGGKPGRQKRTQVVPGAALVGGGGAVAGGLHRSGTYCVRITTNSNSPSWASGNVKVLIDGVEVVPSGFFGYDTTVLNQCYSTQPIVGLNNPTDDGWLGTVELSTDGGSTYQEMYCLDCTTGNDALVGVDGNGDSTGIATMCFGQSTVCSFARAYCARIVTDTGSNQQGYMSVAVEGSEVVPNNILHAQGSTVLADCYPYVPSFAVNNPTTDGWGGAFEVSTDGGATYTAMYCIDCGSSSKDASYIIVDGDGITTGGYTSCAGYSTTCTLRAAGTFCVRITTGTGTSFGGDLAVKVDGVEVRNGVFPNGASVLDQCYPSPPVLSIINPTNDGWGGSFEASTDGGSTYSSMICTDCTSGTTTTVVLVDGDGNMGGSGTECFGTTYCNLYVVGYQPTTASPTKSPTVSPTVSPTASPTESPTEPTTVLGVIGDPHVTNFRGKRFDIHYAGDLMLLQVPRGAEGSATLLRLDGHTKHAGGICDKQLYMDVVNITGAWIMARKDAPVTIKAISARANPTHHTHKQRFYLGGVSIVLSHAETDTGVTYLNLRVSNLAQLKMPVGGLLGEDDYSWAFARPAECEVAEHENGGRLRSGEVLPLPASTPGVPSAL